MTGHITQCTCTVIPPSTPVPGMINVVVRVQFGRSGEKIPVQCVGDAVRLFGCIQSLRPDRTVGGAFHFGYFADFSIPYPFANQVGTFARCSLITHLSNYSGRGGQLGQQTGFVNGVSQRFLAVYVLAHCHGVCRDDGMSMVGGSNDYAVNGFAHFIVHLAIIPVFLRIREFIEYAFGIFPVYVTKGYDVFGALHVVDVGMAHTADTYGCEVQFVGWGNVSVAHT